MFFVDKAVARRLEAAEEMPQVHYANIYQRRRPDLGAACEEIAGGHMVFCGPASPIGRAVGLGIEQAVPASDLERLEEFYFSRGGNPQVDVCPLTDLEFMSMLRERGYAITELNNVLARPLPEDENFPAPAPGISLRPARAEERDLWAEVVDRGFRHDAPGQSLAEMLAPLFEVPGAYPYLAYVDGEVAGGAGGMIIPERGVLALAGTSTLPRFRKRGVQTALLHARMKLAAEAGCEFAVIVTQGGSASQRNAERLGFAVAYSKATVQKG
jgi:GNAT superfamily N-acetyltransferase